MHPTGKPKEKPVTTEEKRFAEGYAAFFDKKIRGRCSSCHSYEDEAPREGPNLTGYGSADWIRMMIVAPAHPSRFGDKNAMPAFRNDQGPGADILLRGLETLDPEPPEGKKKQYTPLSEVDRELIIRYLLSDDRVVFFGRPITGPRMPVNHSAKE